MSNYINTRVLKIKELSEKLEKINQDIQKQISYLEEAKKEFKHNDELSFDIVTSTDNFSIDEKIFTLNRIYLLFKIKDQQFNISINQDYTDLFNKKISLELLFKLSNILSFIEQKTSLLKLSQNILNADKIFNTIYKYNVKECEFMDKIDFLSINLKSFFTYNSLLISDNNRTVFYLIYKEESTERINIKEGSASDFHFSIIEPEPISFFKEDNIDFLNIDDIQKKLMFEIYEEEFFKLNPYIKNLLIPVDFYFARDSMYYCVDYLSEEEFNIIYENLKLYQQLNNF